MTLQVLDMDFSILRLKSIPDNISNPFTFLTITDTSIISQGIKQTIINFADVKSFQVVKMGDQKFVAIHYKTDVEQQKMNEACSIGRIIRFLNRRLVNAQENISTTGTSIKAEELCDLLNERLKRK